MTQVDDQLDVVLGKWEHDTTELKKQRDELSERVRVLEGDLDRAREEREKAQHIAAGQCDGCGSRWQLDETGQPLGDAFCDTCHQKAVADLLSAREELATLKAELIVAKYHKVLDLLGRLIPKEPSHGS